MYNDDPNQEIDFTTPHMGIFNLDDYCDVHDIMMMQHDPENHTKKYFVTDYHQLSLTRMFVMGSMGEDVMPKMSKNMSKINFYQKLYSIDFRTNMFFFKKASFHNYHEIGRHFACFGQSYNHIPGHGCLTRKDLLTLTSMNWHTKLFENSPKCREQLEYVPRGYRLDVKEECDTFFDILKGNPYFRVSTCLFKIRYPI